MRLGSRQSDEARKKMRISHTGVRFSAEHKRKLGLVWLGRKHTDKTKHKMQNNQLGEKNTLWKGDAVGKCALHEWVRSRKIQPDRCEHCGKVTSKLDLANISGWYCRDINDFEYLCRRCHMRKDGRLEKFLAYKPWLKKNEYV